MIAGAELLREIADDVCGSVFSPPPRLTVSEWADAHRVLPATSAEPGRWRTDRHPALRRPMDVLGDEDAPEVVLCFGAQNGKTSVGENFIAYLMHQAPCGVLSVWPTEKKFTQWSLQKLTPLLTDTPALAPLFPASARRSSSNTMDRKLFPGGFFQALTARSPSDLRAHTARVGIAEEVDEWDVDLADQGDPMELLRARSRTFWNRKLLIVSTPTVEGVSRIWKELGRTTWEEYHLPCPHCNAMQLLRWRDGEDDRDDSGSYRFVWEKDQYGEVIPGSTRYLCIHCGCEIEEGKKGAMLRAGEWIARFPGRRNAGFHLPTLYSPFCSWDEVAHAFTRAAAEPGGLKSFVNLFLALPYRESLERMDPDALASRAEVYGAEVPHGVALLTFGADVQGDRVEVHVWGWGAGEESWLIEVKVFDGDPGQDAVWNEMRAYLRRDFAHASGAKLRIACGAIDAGHQTERVHRFCESVDRVIPVVGRSGPGIQLLKAPAKHRRYRSKKRPSYVVGLDTSADDLDSRLRVMRPADAAPSTPVRALVHFPDWVESGWYDQLTAERRVTKYRSGVPYRTWAPISEGRANEAFDCARYARAALRRLELDSPHLLARLPAMARALSEYEPEPEKPKAAPAQRTPRRTGWVGAWK